MSDHPKDLRSVLLLVLQHRNAGYEIDIAAAQALASDARFNQWVARNAKSPDSSVDVLELIECYGELIDECMKAWGKFMGDEKDGELLASLRKIDSKLVELTKI